MWGTLCYKSATFCGALFEKRTGLDVSRWDRRFKPYSGIVLCLSYVCRGLAMGRSPSKGPTKCQKTLILFWIRTVQKAVERKRANTLVSVCVSCLCMLISKVISLACNHFSCKTITKSRAVGSSPVWSRPFVVFLSSCQHKQIRTLLGVQSIPRRKHNISSLQISSGWCCLSK
jgi:hypothetical protein